MTQGPILIDLEKKTDADPAPNPAEAPPVALPRAEDTAMGRVVQLSAGRGSRALRWVLGAALSLLGFVVSVSLYDFVVGLFDRNWVLGAIGFGGLAVLVISALAFTIGELAAISRLRRIDRLQDRLHEAGETSDRAAAERGAKAVLGLYRGRPELEDMRKSVEADLPDAIDASAILTLLDARAMAPLDAAAEREIEKAARAVAATTALVPLTFADVAAALVMNMRMLRAISTLYGGRAGSFGNWRLIRAVGTHLLATGAVAVGDDMIGSIAGGSAIGKVSRRFGEGVLNGALTARVGVAAMEVCRPVPRVQSERTSVTRLTSRALTGLF